MVVVVRSIFVVVVLVVVVEVVYVTIVLVVVIVVDIIVKLLSVSELINDTFLKSLVNLKRKKKQQKTLSFCS